MSKKLHLNLKRRWFDMILSGEKKEEYRELHNYWMQRFLGYYFQDGDSKKPCEDSETYNTLSQNAEVFNDELMDNSPKTIIFSNGYAKDRYQFEIECKGVEIKGGEEKWGAEPGRKYFVLKLGRVLKTGGK